MQTKHNAFLHLVACQCRNFPGLLEGELEVDGADLVASLSYYLHKELTKYDQLELSNYIAKLDAEDAVT